MASRVALSGINGATAASAAQEAIQKTYIDTYAAAGHWPISLQGLKAWTADGMHMAFGNTGFPAASGLTYYTKIYFPKTCTISTLGTHVEVAATTTSGYHGMGLHDASGTLLASTVGDSTLFMTTGWRTKAISPQTVQGGTYGWFSLLTLAAVTRPQLSGTNDAGLGNIINGGGKRFCVSAAGQTAITSFTPASATAPTAGYIWGAGL